MAEMPEDLKGRYIELTLWDKGPLNDMQMPHQCSLREEAKYIERIAKLEQQVAEQEAANEALYAKYEGCPHEMEVGVTCGCSLDRPSDVCAVHAPQLRKAQQQITEQQKTIDRLRAPVSSIEAQRYTSYYPQHGLLMKLSQIDALIAAREEKS